MKHYIDKLRDLPIDVLREKIKRQGFEVAIAQRDLNTMLTVMREKVNKESNQSQKGES